MAYTMWRGVVGLIKPTRRPGSLETLIRLLPEGIGVVPLLLNVKQGSHEEFSSAIPYYEKYVAELAEQGMDLIHPGGTPPFMLLGYAGGAQADKVLGEALQDARFSRPDRITSPLCVPWESRSLSARAILPCRIEIVIDYMTEAGFDVVSMEPIDVPFEQAGQISPEILLCSYQALVPRA